MFSPYREDQYRKRRMDREHLEREGARCCVCGVHLEIEEVEECKSKSLWQDEWRCKADL